MTRILVSIDQRAGVPAQLAEQSLTAASALGEVHAIVAAPVAAADRLALAAAVSRLGAVRLLVPVADPAVDAAFTGLLVTPAVDALEGVLHAAAEAGEPYEALIMPATFDGRETASRVAVRFEAAIVTDAAAIVRSAAGAVEVVKHVFAFGWETRASSADGLIVATLRPGVVETVAVTDTPPAEIVDYAPVFGEKGLVHVVSREEIVRASTGGRPSVTQAKVIVSGGRGMKGDLSPVEELADALGAAVGGSRVAVDAGWLPHAAQIGQTGSVVAPELYVAAGISGAIQHRAGMSASRRVVVVNTDADAPLFDLADLGVVGDLFTVLPATAAIVREARSGSSRG